MTVVLRSESAVGGEREGGILSVLSQLREAGLSMWTGNSDKYYQF